MSKRSENATRYLLLRSRGLCVRCARRAPNPDRAVCEGCKAENRITLRRLRDRAREIGMCTTCRCRPVVEGLTHCQLCCNGNARRRRALQPWCDACFAAGFHRSGCRAAKEAA